MKRMVALILVALLAAAALLPAPVLAQRRAGPIRVFVNGERVVFDQPPILMGARVLVPLRGVFERLGAFVEWMPSTRTVVATRQDTEVQLTVGSGRAYVNGQPVALDVAPMVRGGRVLVPLRFISEALGATVEWREAARTVRISSGFALPPTTPPAAQPRVQPPIVLPAPPSAPVIQGVVLQVDLFNVPNRIVVQANGQAQAVTVTQNTLVRRVDPLTNQAYPMSLGEVRVGDFVRVTTDGLGRAATVLVTPAGQSAVGQQIRGRIELVSGRFIVVDGRTYVLEDTARVTFGGQLISPDQLRAGMDVVLAINPQTGRVAEVNVLSTSAGGTIGGSAPAITVPVTGQTVGLPLLVRGVATPGQRIHVRADYRSTFLILPVQGRLGEATTTADAFGNWQVSIAATSLPLVNLSGAEVTITASAIDASGRRLDSSEVVVRLQ